MDRIGIKHRADAAFSDIQVNGPHAAEPGLRRQWGSGVTRCAPAFAALLAGRCRAAGVAAGNPRRDPGGLRLVRAEHHGSVGCATQPHRPGFVEADVYALS
jgi:hypothetical protein